MVFGWQGFSLEHPEDWVPVALNGSRQAGYARLADPGGCVLQIRWQEGARSDFSALVEQYLNGIKRECARKNIRFDSTIDPKDERIDYRYRAAEHARGALFHCKGRGRLFFLELCSCRRLPTPRMLSRFLSGFCSDSGDPQRWSLLGLDINVPGRLRLQRHELRAGRTLLEFRGERTVVIAERWGFAEQLISKHGLAPWAASVCQLTRPDVSEEEQGLELRQRGRIGNSIRVLVRPQLEHNQITLIQAKSWRRDPAAQWDWFN